MKKELQSHTARIMELLGLNSLGVCIVIRPGNYMLFNTPTHYLNRIVLFLISRI